MKVKNIAAAWCIVGIGLFHGCLKESVDPATQNPVQYRLAVDSFWVDSYNKTTNVVTLKWLPAEGALFYRLYRTAERDADGNLNIAALTSEEGRANIAPTRTSYEDFPGLANSWYYYRIVAVTAHRMTHGIDTIEGKPSQIDSCLVGAEVSFSIAEGAIYTPVRRCSIAVSDPAGKVASVRFSQMYTQHLYNEKKGTVSPEVQFESPLVPPTKAFLDGLKAGQYLSSKNMLNENVFFRRIPNFDIDYNTVDPENAAAAVKAASGPQIAAPWFLKKGNGEKYVWAEVTYKDASQEKDTLLDFIRIRPYRIKMKMRNSMERNSETMRVTGEKGDQYVIYKPWLKFSLSIFADTTFALDFDYWLIFRDSMAELRKSVVDTTIHIPQARAGWLQTFPRHGLLTGYGQLHDDTRIYTYSIDSTTDEGKLSLSQFRRDTLSPQRQGTAEGVDVAWTLLGDQRFNQYAVPGSYWGAAPVRWIKLGGKEGHFSTQETIVMDPADTSFNSYTAMYRQLTKMLPSDKFTRGKKELWVAAVLKGRFFEDTRTYLTSDEVYSVYMDLYPPRANLRKPNNVTWINNRYNIVSSFSYHLNSITGAHSIQDDGGAYIDSVAMVIARMPEGFGWNDTTTPDTITLEQIYEMRHHVFNYPVTIRSRSLNRVRWENIDPTGWPTGRYIFAIMTRDEFGNRGIAPIDEFIKDETAKVTNPWFCNILTGK